MKINIKNYKTLRNATINLIEGEINYIVGSNESGKTNLLNAIRILSSNDEIKIVSKNDKTIIDTAPSKEPIEIEFWEGEISNKITESKEQVWLSKSLSYHEKFIKMIENNMDSLTELQNYLAKEIANWEPNKSGISKIKKINLIINELIKNNLINSKDIKDIKEYEFNKHFKQLQKIIVNFFEGIKLDRPSVYFIQPMENAFKKELHSYPWKDLKSNNSVLRKMIDVFGDEKTIGYLDELFSLDGQENIQNTRSKEKVKENLNQKIKKYFNEELPILKGYPRFLSEGSDLILDIEPSKNTEYQIDSGDEDSRSLGYKSFLRIILEIKALSKDNKKTFYIIDEPEQGLHPYLQLLLIKEIEKLTNDKNNNITFILASHSPYIVSLKDDFKKYEKNLHFVSRVNETKNEQISGETVIESIMEKNFLSKVNQEWINSLKDEGYDNFSEDIFLYKLITDSKTLNNINKSIKNEIKSLYDQKSKKINGYDDEEKFNEELLKLQLLKNKPTF